MSNDLGGGVGNGVTNDVSTDVSEETSRQEAATAGEVYASSPRQIGVRGWWQVAKRTWKEQGDDHVALLAAGVAFFSFIAIFPAMIATVLMYGLVADPEQVARQSQEISAALPTEAATLIDEQLHNLVNTSHNALSIGFVLALLVSWWSASTGIGHLIMAVNTAYDVPDHRSWFKRKAMALVMTLCGIVFVIVAIALIAVVPRLLEEFVPTGPVHWGLEVARWAGLVVTLAVALSVVYRISPYRPGPDFRWVVVGATIATVLCVLISVGLSVYVDQFGRYTSTYGALAGGIVLLLWLWLTAYAVLLGAEISCEAERQPRRAVRA